MARVMVGHRIGAAALGEDAGAGDADDFNSGVKAAAAQGVGAAAASCGAQIETSPVTVGAAGLGEECRCREPMTFVRGGKAAAAQVIGAGAVGHCPR